MSMAEKNRARRMAAKASGILPDHKSKSRDSHGRYEKPQETAEQILATGRAQPSRRGHHDPLNENWGYPAGRMYLYGWISLTQRNAINKAEGIWRRYNAKILGKSCDPKPAKLETAKDLVAETHRRISHLMDTRTELEIELALEAEMAELEGGLSFEDGKIIRRLALWPSAPDWVDSLDFNQIGRVRIAANCLVRLWGM